MTIPAIAPPDSPPPPLDSVAPERVILAPVATGVTKGIVVVGLFVAVTVVCPEVVGRIGAPAVAPGVVYVAYPAPELPPFAFALHCPEV